MLQIIGLPLLFCAFLEQKPYKLILQFHGINGRCVTDIKAMQ